MASEAPNNPPTPTTQPYISKLSSSSRIVIFGGTSGIGFSIASACLAHSAQIIISGSSPAKLSSALSRLRTAYPSLPPSRIVGYTCDLSSADDLEANVSAFFSRIGDGGASLIDHIAFTAGDTPAVTSVLDATVPQIQQAGLVRFVAPLVIAKHASKHVVPGPGSSFTLTGGTNSTKPLPGWAIMAAYGAGIEGMARGLARDLKPLRVNLVSPGAVHTELFDGMGKDRLEEMLAKFRGETLTGEVGRPEDVAEAYLYLMKDRFVTGTVVSSDGGRVLT